MYQTSLGNRGAMDATWPLPRAVVAYSVFQIYFRMHNRSILRVFEDGLLRVASKPVFHLPEEPRCCCRVAGHCRLKGDPCLLGRLPLGWNSH